jgi:hypothetical protein
MQNQNEITKSVKLLNEDGTLAVTGWARRNLFEYDRKLAKPRSRLKEWDFYQISNGKLLVQLSFFNITLASAASATLIDMETGRKIGAAKIELFTRRRNYMPKKSDVPNFFRYEKGNTFVQFDTRKNCKKLEFKGFSRGKCLTMDFTMDVMPDSENITIVTPFKDMPTRFFMTTKQNCMPAHGTVTFGDEKFEFSKSDTFGVMDWGRGVWPHRNCWYWGNGSTYIDNKIFGFEITWKIGDESNATETCLFYDGVAHKIGAVDVEKFPGDGDNWMEPWHFVSEDNRFDLTMTPFYDNCSGAIAFDLGMKTHQVHGLWNGYAVLDDGTRLEIKDMYAFCEYVENRW